MRSWILRSHCCGAHEPVRRGRFWGRQTKDILNVAFDPLAFLYQEYRDTSKQQEIEQRRQRENLPPGSRTEIQAAGSTISSPPVVQLQLRNSARSLSLWQNLELVQQSGLLATLSQKEIIMQEVSVCLCASDNDCVAEGHLT